MDPKESEYLKLAIEQSKMSVEQGGFPAGAILVKDGNIVSRAISIGFKNNDPSGHAESVAIREACNQLRTVNLAGATLYESIECCVMCFTTAYWAGIRRIVFACKKTPEMVERGYYEGSTDNYILNKENNRQIDLIFAVELEESSLAIIQEWEKNGGFNL